MTRGRIVAALAVVGMIVLGVVFGPLLVSGNYHRAAIERLASRLAGRRVTIAGPIELALIPDPQLRASKIIIGGPNGERITAAALKLDLAPGALLLGRLRATQLSLRGPDIVLPWPLPGGSAAIAPPPWLASLHARIVDGRLRIGALGFTHADLSVFTGGPHAVLAASGTARLAGVPVAVTFDLANAGGDHPAPVTASLGFAGAKGAHLAFSGTLGRNSLLAGRLVGTASAAAIADAGLSHVLSGGAAELHADLAADGQAIVLRGIDAGLGRAALAGRAAIDLAPGAMIRLDLTGHDLDPGPALGLLRAAAGSVPFAASLDLRRVSLGGIGFATLKTALVAGRNGVRIQTLTGSLPGKGAVGFAGRIGAAGALHGRFTLHSADLRSTLGAMAKAAPVLANWPHGFGAVSVRGRIASTGGAAPAFRLDQLHGAIGHSPSDSTFTGAIHLAPRGKAMRIAARFAFGRLILEQPALAGLLAATAKPDSALIGPIVLTAQTLDLDKGGAKPAILPIGERLLIDAHLGGGVAVRLASLRVGRALLVGHGIRAANGAVTAARAMLTGPDAAATLHAIAHLVGTGSVPKWARLLVFRQHFAAALAAAGPAKALHTGVTLHLGTARIAATPIVDLATDSAAGPLSLRAPSAIALLGQLGGKAILGARDGLDWPGAGSVGLRASAFATGDMLGLAGFVGSFGALTASGRLTLATGPAPTLAGAIAADTLVLPAPQALLTLADMAIAAKLTIALPRITASRIELAAMPLARDAAFSLALTQGKLAPNLTLAVGHARVAGGVLDGSAELTGAAAKSPPTLTVAGHLRGAGAARIAALSAKAGITLPFTSGSLDLATSLTATGGTQSAWRGDVSGSLTGSASKLGVSGIDLAKAGAALGEAITARRRIGRIAAATLLRRALSAGRTGFDKGNFSATIAKGGIALDTAGLTGKSGGLTASGTLDPAGRRLDITATAHPVVAGHKSAPDLPIMIGGNPAHPSARPELGPAMNWIDKHTPHPSAP